MPTEAVEIAEEKQAPAPRAQEEKGGVKIVVSASVVSAVIAALTTVMTGRATSADADRIADRVRSEVMKEASAAFVVKGVDDTRWTYYTQGVDERLRAIAAQLESIDRRTADLPKIAAKLEMMERSAGK